MNAQSTGSKCTLAPQVDQLVDGSLPPARQREPRREGLRRKEAKSKATVKEGDKHEKPVAVEENSAVESLCRYGNQNCGEWVWGSEESGGIVHLVPSGVFLPS